MTKPSSCTRGASEYFPQGLTRTYKAHVIRRRNTKQFRAISYLSAQLRWCLTGTPIQNCLEDLGSLVRFLRISPLDKVATFRKHIIHPLKSGEPDCLRNLRLLLDCVCLRRTKDLLGLPESLDEIRMLEL